MRNHEGVARRLERVSEISLRGVERVVGRRLSPLDVIAGAAAGVVSLIVWYVTMASAPLYSHPPHEDMGNAALFPVLLGTAFLGGVTARRQAAIIGVMLVAPALVLSPWTAPRGDNDGLWLLIVPMLAFLMALTVMVARLGAWLHSQLATLVRRRTQH